MEHLKGLKEEIEKKGGRKEDEGGRGQGKGREEKEKKGKDRGVDIERKGEGVSPRFKNMNNSYRLLRAQHVSNMIIDSLIIKKKLILTTLWVRDDLSTSKKRKLSLERLGNVPKVTHILNSTIGIINPDISDKFHEIKHYAIVPAQSVSQS